MLFYLTEQVATEAEDIDMSRDAVYDRNASTLFFTELFRGEPCTIVNPV